MDEDIEESARLYEEDNGELHIRSDFLIADDEEPRTVRVAFILNLVNDALKSKGVLFSIDDEDVPVFRLLRLRAPGARADRRREGSAAQAVRRRCRIFRRHAGRHLRRAGKVSKQVLAGEVTDTLAREVLGAIALQEDLNGRIRRNVIDTRSRRQLHDAQPHAQRRPVRGSAADPARYRIAGQPHRRPCSTRSTS